MIYSVCSTSECRTTIHVGARFHPKVILAKCSEWKATVRQMPACVMSDVTIGQWKARQTYTYSKKSTGIA